MQSAAASSDSRRQNVSSTSETVSSCDNNISLAERKEASNRIVQANASGSRILVHTSQKGNPLLSHIQNVGIQMEEDILPDYVLGSSCCALFLSLRYHLLHPQYITTKCEKIGREYRVRILLVYVDIQDSTEALQGLNVMAIHNEVILLLAWSWKEAGRYLETIKSYEHKSVTLLKERIEMDYTAQLNDILTFVRAVNKTDVMTLASTFGSLHHIMSASIEALALCPGLGERKVQNLYEIFHEPFDPHNNNSEA